jgi:putative ABC transport system permease protein
MHFFTRIRNRFRAFTDIQAVDRDLDDELTAHLEASAAEYEAGGLSRKAALLAARRDFGAVTQVMEECREVHRMPWLANMGRDGAFGWRLLKRSPGFAVAAIVTLALGLGANTAIYSVIRGVLLRPSPLPSLSRLVMLWETDRSSGTTHEPASVPDFLDYQTRARTVDALVALMATEVNLTRPSADPERLLTLRVSHGMLPMLDVAPVAGRGFLEQEDRPGGPNVALISQSLARRLFERPDAGVGQTLMLDEQPQTIVGVVPDTTDFGVLQILSTAAYSRSFADRGQAARVDVWKPLQPNPSTLPRETHPIFVLGRLAPSSTRPSAQAEMQAIAADLEREFPVNRGRGANVELLSDVIFGPVRPTLYLLAAAVFVVLLIACVNVANLQLARGAARTQEVAIRAALGAGRRRLFGQFITESLMLTYIASAVGIALAFVSMRGLLALAPADVPRMSLVSLDGSVLGAALIMASVVALTFGVLPALQARRVDLVTTLKDDGAGKGTAGPERKRVRGALVVAELAAAVMLLSGAGLLIRSFWNLQHVAPGFQPEGVLKAEFQLPASRYPANMRQWPNFPEHHAFARAVLARAAGLPGVTEVALAGNHPLDPGFTNSFRIIGREPEGANWPEISVRAISPGYLETVRLPLMRGRTFTDADDATSPPVALINQTAAERFFQGRDPIGAQIRFWGIPRTIVGIVGNERIQGLSSPAPIAAYVSTFQAPSITGAGVLLVRAAGDPVSLSNAVRNIFREQDPLLAVFGVESLDQALSRSVSQRRFAMVLVTAFAGVALLLAGIGVYGVFNYDVTVRRRELSIRLALGAARSSIVRLVVNHALLLIGLALAIGISAAFGFTTFLSSLLFGVEAHDPVTLVGVASLLAVIAIVASAVPAWRASRIDPSRTLRAE